MVCLPVRRADSPPASRHGYQVSWWLLERSALYVPPTACEAGELGCTTRQLGCTTRPPPGPHPRLQPLPHPADKGHTTERSRNPNGSLSGADRSTARDAAFWDEADVHRRMDFSLRCVLCWPSLQRWCCC